MQDTIERSERVGELYEVIAAIMPERSTEAWLAAFKELDIPCAPVQRLDDLHGDDHLNDIEFFPRLTGPVSDHASSDDCGVRILGAESEPFWHDHKGAKVNALRTRTMIGDADLVVVRFGEKYKEWDATFDAGYAAALGKPLSCCTRPNISTP